MDHSTFFRLTGYTLLGLLVGALFIGVAQVNDQKRVVGYDRGTSLEAHCAPGHAAFFTNRERLAVFMEKADGRVSAQPVFRGGQITGLACDPRSGELIVATEHGERRVYIAQARADGRELALMP